MHRLIFSIFSIILFITTTFLSAQDSPGTYLKDPKTGCKVWFKVGFQEDSVRLDGGCKDGLAEGLGTFTGYTQGKETSRYTGQLKAGKPDGTGKFSFWSGGGKLDGHFIGGEFLEISTPCLNHLHKNIASETDSLDCYVGDNNAKQLYYHIIVPDQKVRGAIVLLPGTWETTEHMLSSNKKLCELAFEKHLAVIALSINQRLTMTPYILGRINQMLGDVHVKYHIPQDKFVIGGWSMGGLFSLRYTEFACQDSAKTAIKPAAVFSCDGPCDLENLYINFQKKLKKFPGSGEPDYGIKELEKYCGGNPATARGNYVFYSCYSHSQADGGNARYLKNIPVRIYDDVDANWWIDNRDVDMYDMNALDQTAMIVLLKDLGNNKAEFINAFGKGYRLEGNRHPHSWSIIEPEDFMKWVMKVLK